MKIKSILWAITSAFFIILFVTNLYGMFFYNGDKLVDISNSVMLGIFLALVSAMSVDNFLKSRSKKENI